MDLLKLLQRYFAKELPPTFTTANFASVMNSYALDPFKKVPSSAMLVKHEIPRHDLTRRVIGIPNPIFHYRLCREIVSSWRDIDNIYRRSTISKTSPSFIENASEEDKDPLLNKLNTRALSSYILKTDISRCFPSIYTHSIPWAIHTKRTAKAQRTNNKLIGNKLDTLVRQGQDNQTIGIPIGPYTSVVISELILSAIDAELEQKIPSLRGTRYVDDFELGFKTYLEAENCLRELNLILGNYELEINQLKTEIIKLPTSLETKWVQSIRKFNLDVDGYQIQKRSLLAYFDEVLTLLEANSQEHVLNYALTKLTNIQFHQENYKILQDFLFQCLMIDSSTFLRVFNLLQMIYPRFTNKPAGGLDYSTFSKLLHHHIKYNCDLKKGHEVAWAIWGMIYWGIHIEDDAAKALSSMDDSIVALTALHANDLGLIPSGLDTKLWETYMNEDGLYSSQWLLAYEAAIQGWLPSRAKTNYVAKDANFSILESNRVKFYDTSQVIGTNLSDLLELNITQWGHYGVSEDEDEDNEDQVSVEDTNPF